MEGEITSLSDFKKWCRGVSPYAFEEIVAEIFRDNGFKAEVTPQTNDGGLDVILYDETDKSGSATSSVNALVEVKRPSGIYDTVSPEVLQKLVKAASEYDPDRLIIVTTRKFSSTVEKQATETTEYEIELLQPEDLYNMGRDERLSTLSDRYDSHPGLKNWWSQRDEI